MIGHIRGTLLARQAPEILVEVGGIGYEVQVPMTTLYQLPELGETVTLLTHFVVREDAQQLFGFADAADRRLFRELIKVSGVGPRLALTLLSGMDAADFARCLQRDDVAALVALPGVGRKTAERLLVEMRDKAGDWLDGLSPGADDTQPLQDIAAVQPDQRAEAEQALVTLGFKLTEAAKLIASADAPPDASSEDLIRLALKIAGGGQR
ncbi:MAG: Holliday junction branch migration protein RuvA [Halieaceae bacterium]|jgi:Holliday junction DNA helicase RuvA